jgi:hypothetical protein
LEFTKLTTSQIEVTRTIKPAVTKTTYDFDALVAQKEAITIQRDEMIKLKESELAEVEILLAECVKLGIKSEVIETII